VQKEMAPQPLEKEKSFDISLRSGRRNLVERLYDDVVNKTPALKQLEAEINALEEGKSDSTKDFDDFNNKNSDYYADGALYAADVTDSVLKEYIKKMLTESQARYKGKAENLTNLEGSINSKSETLNDLHILLKLSKTIHIMENYQNTNMPLPRPLENIADSYNIAIKKTDSLAKK
jgi:hypothetical protein